MKIQDFSWNSEIFWFWVEKALIWALFYYYFVQSAKTVIFCPEIDSRGIFFAFFTKFSRIFIFHENFMLFSEKMHLKTYALDNDLLGNYQTTGDFLAKSADFSVLGLKSPNLVIFMKNWFLQPKSPFSAPGLQPSIILKEYWWFGGSPARKSAKMT